MLFLILFTVLRLLWFTERYLDKDGWAVYFANRLAQLFLFSGFSLYLESWVIVVRQSSGQRLVRGKDDTDVLDKATWIINLSVWALVFALSMSHFATEKGALYNSGGVVLAALTLALMLVVMFFGYLMQDAMSMVQLEAVQRLRRSIIVTSIVCFVCFSTRTAIWLYHPLSGHRSPYWTYPWLFYTCVEIPPVVALFGTLAAPLRDRLSRSHARSTEFAKSEFKASITQRIGAALQMIRYPGQANDMLRVSRNVDSVDFTHTEETSVVSSPLEAAA